MDLLTHIISNYYCKRLLQTGRGTGDKSERPSPSSRHL